ncbi:MAG: rRNA maturation RNase YbeY [Gammaproteobacteria bacterium]
MERKKKQFLSTRDKPKQTKTRSIKPKKPRKFSLQLGLQVQKSLKKTLLPKPGELEHWVEKILAELRKRKLSKHLAADMNICLVDEKESARLNEAYRSKKSPTNILTFSYDLPKEIASRLLYGDLIICFPIALKEAKVGGIKVDDHLVHLILHGMLHLLGYDHENDKEADEMEQIEIEILEKLKVPNPYANKVVI